MSKNALFEKYKNEFETYFLRTVDDLYPNVKTNDKLFESSRYSLLAGGKRFRPILSIMTANALGVSSDLIFPFACALELVHTSSLIHDDLPCMDNDDFRRGLPTNHKVYGTAIALLAGNCLLLDSSLLIAKSYKNMPKVSIQLIELLITATSTKGMMWGQAIDISANNSIKNFPELKKMQELKTGGLIRVSVEGAAILAGLNVDKMTRASEFGSLLGLAFQVKDDLMDFNTDKSQVSFPHMLGFEEANQYLQKISLEASSCLKSFANNVDELEGLIKYNLEREI